MTDALGTNELEVERGSFRDGAVVQLTSGTPDTPDAVVATLHPATIKVTDRRVIAVADRTEWSWLLTDVERVSHSAEGRWSILEVPGVPDHGVAVGPDDVAEFRRRLDAAIAPLSRDGAAIQRQPAALDGAGHVEGSNGVGSLGNGTARTARADLARLVGDVDDLHPLPLPPHSEPVRTHYPTRPPAPPGEDPAVGLAALEAREVSAWFGTHHVLDRVSLQMAAGQVTALIGPSGCGKSTFLRILNRMHEMIPSASLAGEVLLDGSDIYDIERRLTDARRQIGMVFQKPNPFPAMSIYDNVVASFRLTGSKASSEEKDDTVESCLRKAGLWNEVRERLREPGGGLSGGQQQRLCIARALAVRPRVLLMDEPCSALDPTSTRRIEQTLFELADEVTIVIVTHNMQQAARVSHRCALFLAEQGTPGVIVEHGPTEAMFSSPQDQRTSDYVNGRFG